MIEPTSRVKRTRPPFAETSKSSFPPEPLKTIRSRPSWPSSTSLPSPGFQIARSSFAPRKATSSPRRGSTVSSPSPPSSVSSPSPPVTVSFPAPASTMSLSAAAGSVAALTVSSPPRALMVSESAGSALRMRTRAARPVTAASPGAPSASMASPPSRPSTVTRSRLPSAAPRSASSAVSAVPRRSRTVVVSAPPSASRSIDSTASVSMSMPPTLRKKCARRPSAVTSKASAPFEPVKRSVSCPACPSTVSLPSPGAQSKRSLPWPSRAMSSPPRPTTVSRPVRPRNVSAPAPPRSVSLPAPPSIVVGILSVNAPPASLIRTRSAPPRVSTRIRLTRLRLNVKSGDPLAPRSTTRRLGLLAFSRRARVCADPLPVTCSVPWVSLALVERRWPGRGGRLRR